MSSWAGTILDRDRPVVIIAAPGTEKESALRLGRIGLDIVNGYLADGLSSLAAHPELVATTERVSPEVAAARLASAAPPVAIDVRSRTERAQKTIAGSTHLPLNQLRAQLSDMPRDRPLLVFCAGGYRSSIGASLLKNAGIDAVSEIAGGLGAWEANGYPVAAR